MEAATAVVDPPRWEVCPGWQACLVAILGYKWRNDSECVRAGVDHVYCQLCQPAGEQGSYPLALPLCLRVGICLLTGSQDILMQDT